MRYASAGGPWRSAWAPGGDPGRRPWHPGGEALRAWRAEVAKSHNLPAFMIFQDATLAAVAALGPASLDALAGVSGIGAKKLQAYGEEVLRVVAGAGLGHNLRP